MENPIVLKAGEIDSSCCHSHGSGDDSSGTHKSGHDSFGTDVDMKDYEKEAKL